MHHISTDDLERYHLRQVRGLELGVIEEHLLWCQSCLDRREATERFIRLVKAGVIRGSFEIELLAEELKPAR